MKISFWNKCWEENRVGFHQKQVHPFLLEHFTELVAEGDQHVFVPLCGKSHDMSWLAQHFSVTGAELSALACKDFFSEQDITPQEDDQGEFKRFSFENVSLWQGDFFKLTSDALPRFDWIYDRAALIALPPEMQVDYVKQLTSFMKPDTRLLLISLEFPVGELSGPPFNMPIERVKSLFDGFDVECLATKELSDKRFAQLNLAVSHLVERVYLISGSGGN